MSSTGARANLLPLQYHHNALASHCLNEGLEPGAKSFFEMPPNSPQSLSSSTANRQEPSLCFAWSCEDAPSTLSSRRSTEASHLPLRTPPGKDQRGPIPSQVTFILLTMSYSLCALRWSPQLKPLMGARPLCAVSMTCTRNNNQINSPVETTVADNTRAAALLMPPLCASLTTSQAGLANRETALYWAQALSTHRSPNPPAQR